MSWYRMGVELVLSKRTWRILFVLVSWLPFSLWANPQLIDIRYSELADQEFEVELIFDQPFTAPVTTIEDNPQQLVMNFYGAESALSLNTVPVLESGVRRINLKQSGNGLAVHTVLDRMRPYTGVVEGTSYILRMGALSGADKTVNTYLNRINSIDFKPYKKGGELLVQMDTKAVATDVTQKANRIELSFFDMDIVSSLIAVLDVSDYETLIESVDVTRDKSHTRMVLTMNQGFAYTYQQNGNLFSLKVEPKADPRKAAESYEGKPISLNFQDVPVRTVLQIIADYNGFNLVTTDSVNGSITLRLEGVPWDQALDMILRIRGLGKRMEGNILLVAPSEELSIREAQELKAKQEVSKLEPLFSEYIQVNYAKADDIAQLLKSGDANMLSERGTVTVDERTNTLLIRDTVKQLEEVQGLIKVLDRPVKQVQIESRVVTVRDSVSEDLGVRWGLTSTFDSGSGTGATSGTIAGADSASSGVVGRPGTTPDLDDRLNVNLPAAESGGTIAFQIAKLADGKIMDLELSALELENKGEIIASPRITTANQKAAYIEQGVEIPYQESTSSGATNISFKKAVLSLKVTPQITPDNRVVLDLVITQDTLGTILPTGNGNAPAVDKQEVSTQVLVDNGETIVLGGIYQQEITKVVKKVPLLGDLPGLGWLFRSTSDKNEKRELLIFVTPRIISESL